MRLATALVMTLFALAACGVDGEPTPPVSGAAVAAAANK